MKSSDSSKPDRQEPELNRQGAELLRRVFPMLSRLANAGTERDKARNRRLHYSQYAGLILLGLFNPLLQSSRALVAASGLRNVRKLTGGRQVSLGSFSEASSVFDPQLLAGLVGELRTQWERQTARRLFLTARRSGAVSNELLERLVAVDASVLSALPQLVARFSDPRRGQWRLHAHVRVLDGVVLNAEVTPEPAAGEHSERAMLEQMLSRKNSQTTDESPALYLMDRGYRSALLFNRIRATGADYVCRLNRVDGRLVQEPPRNERGEEQVLPPLSAAGRAAGVVADEWITLGGGCGASPTGTDHPVRRIRVIPSPDRQSSARQGRVRSDQSGREELVLATTLVDLPAEEVVALYEYRWQVELFFRFLKQVLGCKQLLSAKTSGVRIQLYCALIAALLLALATGGNVTRRGYEMLGLYFSGWAEEDELWEALAKPPPSRPKP